MVDQDVLELDSLEPPFNVDPYPTYARLRQGPVRRVRMLGLPAWLVTRYVETNLDGIVEAYEAMDQRRAIKSLIRIAAA